MVQEQSPWPCRVIPKYRRPAGILGFPAADSGKEDEGRGMCKEGFFAALLKNTNSEFPGKTQPLLVWIHPPELGSSFAQDFPQAE